MDRLIPFKVIVKVSREDVGTWFKRILHPAEGYRLPGGINADAVLGKEWTVVGLEGSCFLLVRPGEIAQWWPLELCEVKEVTKIL